MRDFRLVLSPSRIVTWMSAMAILASCSSRVVQYDHLVGPLPYQGTHTVGIATLDKRTAVIDGSRKPDFVGYLRSAVGVAWPIGTKSKMSLSDDFSSSIAATLARKGYKTKELKTEPSQSTDEVTTRLVNSGGDRLLLVVMKQWATDGYGDQALDCDLEIYVLDTQGNKLATNSYLVSQKRFGGNWATGAGRYKEYTPIAVRNELGLMLSLEDIRAALE